MFKFLTQGTKIMRMRSGIIAIATLAVLAAVITTLALSSFTAEAQGNSGAVADLQLSSTSAGTLTVSWDAASPTPTDYRVDWAKSGEDYQSWKVDDGHVYTAETVTTTTITDLTHDTEYKIRMRARYYKGEHEGKSWGGPWATATITVTGEPAEPVQQPPKEEPVQQPPRDAPDPPAGTIETITAADDTGQLLLTWTAPAAPNADPTDYHVNWGKSTEEYPADTATDGNDHPTNTTLTLTVLEFNTDYNIRVRARYTDGDHTASPWNGPWIETTAQVKLPPPVAPSFINTAVSEGQVLLSWFKPSDDSITGYQILRGPDAGNLVVIEDDTGSSSTSYTDETPPVGHTHTYGVRARNSVGLSPVGMATATVPAAEVLVTARHESAGNTLVSNLGQPTPSGAGAVAGTFGGSNFDQAIRFTTGANPNGYHLTGVQLYLQQVFAGFIPIPMVSIRGDNGGLPGETVIYTLTTSTTITNSFQLLEFTTTDDFALQPNTRYWLHVTASAFPMTTQYSANSDEDMESNVGWEIGDGWYGRSDADGETTWTEYPNITLRMGIHGHAAPEFLVSNLEAANIPLAFTRNTNLSGSKLAQSFSAANNVGGSSAEFDFDGITALLQSSDTTPAQLASSDIFVTVHSDTNGQPGDLVYTMIAPETYTLLPDGSHITFSAPPGSTLSSGVTYWVKFEIAPDSTFFVGEAEIFFGYTTDDTEVQGPYADNDWSIQDDSLWSPETLSWTTDPTRSVKISVLGSQSYDTLVSNIDQPSFTGTQSVSSGLKAAQSFHTPSGPLGQQYRFSSVRIIASSQNPTQATVDLHADDNGAPGDHLASFTTPGDFAPGLRAKDDFIGVAPRDILLNTDTRYWIVFSNAENFTTFRIGITRSETEDLTSLDGWTIGDSRVKKVPDQPWDELYDPIQMELLGTPFIRTNEADGPDLPGAGHNAHQTGAVVIPGIVSTGHLTPSLDYDHGHSGDYWWLETQRGHSYRVEVKFGDNPDNDTGGSAWMSFIDPDHDDYPYASGCCEADHNRDDGHTFVHFYRPTDDWNNRYLINVAAFDKLNTGSSTYNGPYTITMTDITGTREFVSNLYQDSRSDLLEVGAARQYAMFFETGHHAAGYQLDRIQTFITHQGSPEFSLYSNTIDVPGTKLCDFRNPLQVQHHVTWSAGPPALTFLAPDCAEITLMPTGSAGILHTLYWIVMEGTNYGPSGMDSYAESAYGPGWRIGDIAVTKTTGSWVQDPTSKIIPISVWLSER